MPLKLVLVVMWLTMIGLIVTPVVYLTGMMNDPVVENSMSPDVDSWGIPMFGDLIVGAVLAAIVYGLTKHLTNGYNQPGLFAWRRDRLSRSLGFTLLAAIIIILPVLAIAYDLLNGAPAYEYDLVPLLVLGVLWVAMLRAAAITRSEIEEARAQSNGDATRDEILVSQLKSRAMSLGFDAFGIAAPDTRPDLREKLDAALERGWQDGMAWMSDAPERRSNPAALWDGVRSVIMLGMNYGPDRDPMESLGVGDRGTISVYARNRDYHEIIKGKLKEMAGLITRTGADAKVFVDTAPVMEKPLAEAAGLGWQGKNTILVSREFGSWLLLGAIFTSAELPIDAPHEESCGTCTRCLDVCPTQAFPAPFQLDARRCLSYLNIEHEGPIPLEFRKPMGNRIYGCDDCLAVCPWNKFASASREAKLQAREDLRAPSLADLAGLDEAGFRELFAGSPVKRIGHERFRRNVLIAIGNSGHQSLLGPARRHLADSDPVVRGAAVWAIRRLAAPDEAARLALDFLATESDITVRTEWIVELP